MYTQGKAKKDPRLKFTLDTERQSLIIKEKKSYKQKFKNKTPANPGEGGASDLYSYHIIKFKYPKFSQKITKPIKKQKSTVHPKEKSISTQSLTKTWWQIY